MADLIVIVCANCNITVDCLPLLCGAHIPLTSSQIIAHLPLLFPCYLTRLFNPLPHPMYLSQPFLLLHSTRPHFTLNLPFSWFLYLPCRALPEARSPCSFFGGKSGKCHMSLWSIPSQFATDGSMCANLLSTY